MVHRSVPDRKEFDGAEVWFTSVPDSDLARAATKAFDAAGLRATRVLSKAPCNPAAVDGQLPPDEATKKLSDFFTAYVTQYVIPMMGIAMRSQQQSIQMARSCSSAMNVCACDPSCTVVPSSDGSGAWEVQIQ